MPDDALIDRLHREAWVADGHADTLMWNRDLNARTSKGHVDFPRLYEGGAKMQCFTLVTRGLPVIDGFGPFTWWNRWPREARRNEWTRALWQIEQLERFCAASNGRAALARTRLELDENDRHGRLNCILGVEGAHVVCGDPKKVEELWNRGVRFMSLTHLGDSEIGGSSFPLYRAKGLTTLGREVLSEMERVGMAVDVAHAAPKVLEEIFSSKAKVFCSHSGIAAATPSWRNLDDASLKEIARRGGVVGVIFAVNFIGGSRLSNLVRHIEKGLEIAGEGHIVLGSDYDGFIRIPKEMRDVSDVKLVTRALVEQKLPESTIRDVLGDGYRRFFAGVMP